MEFFLILLVVLAVVVLVGHGIWVAAAWILRGGRSRRSPALYEPTLSDDRAATARFLRHLRNRGTIDEEAHARIMRAIAEDVHPAAHSVESYMSRKREREETTDREVTELESAPAATNIESTSAPAPPIEHPAGDSETADSPTPQTAAKPPWFQIQTEASSPARQPTPRRAFSEILASFMAEKNIRWGELIGGLLIVCSSAALVISLWSRIEAIPVLKFVIFTAMTGALFGAGLFVYHRWKIPTTGQVVLLVATLLVPLNLLAFSAFSLHGPVREAWTTPIELAAVALFGWLSLVAARVVMPAAPGLYAVGIVGVSASSLVVRSVAPLSGATLWGMALLPIVLYVAVMVVSFRRLARGRRIDEKVARCLFLQLGAQTFACLVPFGLIAYESGLAAGALCFLAPLVCVLAGPALFTGVFIWRRLEHGVSSQIRTVAASAALVAAGVMLLGAGLAWPIPSRLIPATLVVGIAMAALSRVTRYPAAHASAAAWLTAAWVLCVHVLAGLPWSINSTGEVLTILVSARTGQALVGAVAACALLAAWFSRRHRLALSHTYAAAASAIATISLVLVTVHGFGRTGDPAHVTWVYVVYAIAAFVAAGRANSALGVWCGGILGQMAISQLWVYLWLAEAFAWPTALLVGASVCAASVVAFRFSGLSDKTDRLYVDTLAKLGVVISLLASAWMLCLLPAEALSGFAIRMGWLSAVWLVLAIAMRWSSLLAGAQLAMVGATAAGVQAHLQGKPWYVDTPSPLTEPWVLQAHAVAVGVVCLIWSVARRAFDWRVARASIDDADLDAKHSGRQHWPATAQKLLNPIVPLADRWITILVVAALAVLSLWSAGPGVIAEHGWGSLPVSASLHVHAAGWGSWLLLGVLAVNLLLGLTRRIRFLSVLGILVATACAATLVAARFENRHQIVTAMRWLFASIFLASSCAVWMRGALAKRLSGRARHDIHESGTVEWAPALLCVLFAMPAAALTITFAQAAATGAALLPASVSELGLRVLLLGPPILVAIGLMGYGRRERQPGYAAATAVFACAVVTVTELCALSRANISLSYAFLVWLVQVNVLVSAAVAIAWRVVQGWEKPAEESPRYPPWPLWAGRTAVGVVLFLAAGNLWIRPGAVSADVAAAGTAWGLFAVVLLEWALWSVAARSASRHDEHAASVWVLFGTVLAASALARFDTGNWLCFHVLMMGFVAAGWLRMHFGARDVRHLLGSGWRETFETASAHTEGSIDTINHDVTCQKCGYNLRGLSSIGRCPECDGSIADSLNAVVDRLTPQWAGRLLRVRTHTATAVLACAALATLFAVRAAFDDPQRPWWSIGALAASGALCVFLAGWTPRRAFAYAGCLEVCLAASVWWTTEHWRGPISSNMTNLCDLVNVNIIAVALAGLAWLGVERRIIRGQVTEGFAGRWPALHCIAAYVSSAGVMLLAGVALGGAVAEQSFAGSAALQWSAWGAAVALLIACRLDSSFRQGAAGIYALGLTAVVLIMAQIGLSSETLAWAMSLGLAAYVLLTTLVWRRYAPADRDSLQQPADGSWLLVANGLLATVSVFLGLYVSFTNPAATARMVVVASPILCALSAAIAAIGRRRELMQTIALSLVVTGAVLLSWFWAPQGASAFLLQRSIGAIAAVTAVILASGAARAVDREGGWATAIARSLTGSCAFAGAALLFCSGTEIHALVSAQPVQLATPAVAALIVSLTLLVVCCVVFAVQERLDPLRLRPSLKGSYVYVAEWLAGALVLHIRATMPWLFSGVVTQYWPMLVMGLAFAAIAAGEVCTRRGLHVLARPLGRTGMFLPVLGLIELFLASSQVHFSIVLLTTGALYAVLAGLRKSVGLGLIAAMSLNGSLWYLLSRSTGLGLTQHPQLWFIPPALAILAAGHLNRTRLSGEQRAALHYVCLLIVYLSSTADIFLIGVARAPWLPLVLMGLSLVGILFGFVSRIRSFLFLGTGFLCLSLLTMIWHAATNLGWTWLWYVAGIVLGVGIITVFALFEKKRNEMNAWIEELRNWAG